MTRPYSDSDLTVMHIVYSVMLNTWYFIGFAGTPTAVQFSGISFTTTAPAPIMLHRPTDFCGMTAAFEPISQPSFMVTLPDSVTSQ